jgi:hypothetical protein
MVVDVVGAATGEASSISGRVKAISADSTSMEVFLRTIAIIGMENLLQ